MRVVRHQLPNKCTDVLTKVSTDGYRIITSREEKFPINKLRNKSMAFPKVSDFNRYSVSIINVHAVTDDVREITFKKPEGASHVPGQFVGIMINDGQDEPGYRSYSLLEDSEGNLQIVVRLVEGGRGSTYLFAKKPGDQLDILYPLGYFGLPDDHAKKMVFIATGTGLVPLLALIESLPASEEHEITLLFGIRHIKDLFYQERLADLQKTLPNCTVCTTISQPEGDLPANTTKGRVTAHLPLDPSAQYFMCGSGAMIADVTDTLKKNGVKGNNIFYEDFNS